MGGQQSLFGGTSDALDKDDMEKLGRPTASPAEKQAAFRRVRAHLCKSLTLDERQQAVKAVEERNKSAVLWAVTPEHASALPLDEVADRVRGLVFGAALGDATGLSTEFLSQDAAQRFYGEDFAFSPQCQGKVFPDLHRTMWAPGDWTDDTDQLLLILQSLFASGGTADEQDFARRLLDWKEHGFSELGDTSGAGLGAQTKAVLQREDFCDNPATVARERWATAGKGAAAANGAVMRTAITGVGWFWDEEKVEDNTKVFCRATHADPRCLASCVAVASCVSALLRGEDQRGCAEGAPDASSQAAVEAVIAAALQRAVAVLRAEAAAVSDVWGEPSDAQPAPVCSAAQAEADLRAHCDKATGEGLRALRLDDTASGIGYTYKCLGAALWALNNCHAEADADKQAVFKSLICAIVREGGDADTNACVAGALIGCRIGFSNLPAAWVAEMPHASWLEAHTQKLLGVMGLRRSRNAQ